MNIKAHPYIPSKYTVLWSKSIVYTILYNNIKSGECELWNMFKHWQYGLKWSVVCIKNTFVFLDQMNLDSSGFAFPYVVIWRWICEPSNEILAVVSICISPWAFINRIQWNTENYKKTSNWTVYVTTTGPTYFHYVEAIWTLMHLISLFEKSTKAQRY